MDEGVEAVIDCLSDHLSSWDELGVEPVENILEVFPLSGFFRVEELEELLNEGWGDMYLEGLDISAIIDDKLKEELIDGLQMEPGWVG